jgi:hypothetical protein
MKLRPINIIEIIAALLFIAGHFLKGAHIPYMGLLSVLGGLTLGVLYFNLGFLTLKSPEISVGNLIAYGLLLGTGVIALIFSAQHWPMAEQYLTFCIAFFILLALMRIVFTYLLKQKRVLTYNKGIAIRYLVILIFMIVALLSYKIK